LNAASKELNTSPEDLRQLTDMSFQRWVVMSAAPVIANASDIAIAGTKFITNPQQVSVGLNPSAPITFNSVIASGATSGDAALYSYLNTLNIFLAVNSDPPIKFNWAPGRQPNPFDDSSDFDEDDLEEDDSDDDL
jgi:hypothetical protein